jgi:hypothetical protein
MKTALQEFIDNVIPMHIIELDMIKQEIKKALEKEKEQIIQAHGLKYYDIGEVTITGENYYNQTYNRKIPELLYKNGTPMRKVKLGKEAQELLDESTKRFNQPNL